MLSCGGLSCALSQLSFSEYNVHRVMCKSACLTIAFSLWAAADCTLHPKVCKVTFYVYTSLRLMCNVLRFRAPLMWYLVQFFVMWMWVLCFTRRLRFFLVILRGVLWLYRWSKLQWRENLSVFLKTRRKVWSLGRVSFVPFDSTVQENFSLIGAKWDIMREQSIALVLRCDNAVWLSHVWCWLFFVTLPFYSQALLSHGG